MKRISLLLSVILTSLTLSAQEADKALALDSLSTVIRNAEVTIAQLSSEVTGLKQENAALVTANENFKKRLRNVEVFLKPFPRQERRLSPLMKIFYENSADSIPSFLSFLRWEC